MKNIKAIFLDVGDTILFLKDNPSQIYLSILQKHGYIRSDFSREALKESFNYAWNFLSSRTDSEWRDRYSIHPRGEGGWWKELIQVFLEHLHGTELSIVRDEVFDEIFKRFDSPEIWEIEPGLMNLIEFCRTEGIFLGIISNWDLRLRGILEKKNLTQYFHPILISAEFGYEKPSPKIFLEAQNHYQFPAENYLYIGDKEDLDFLPTQKLGWNSLILSKTKEKNLHTIHTLSEVPERIRSGRG
ncbi:MAG: HAD-IA family hydrolase [Leptospiraceae bacterium]|nr:HAD-IA family hydrolase [Leptospiraceae bacterium]MCP5511669.1 HAD-IA family hydrolase [Leptospiraceae bacterium]